MIDEKREWGGSGEGERIRMITGSKNEGNGREDKRQDGEEVRKEN